MSIGRISDYRHCFPDDANIEELINHPVHISDGVNKSVFIPFCFFGDLPLGRQSGHFQDPVCNLFKRKVVRGQICYEADINKFKGKVDDWEEALQTGFSFIIDTNDEYDVKNLLEKKSSSSLRSGRPRYRTAYQRSVSDKRVNILLKTISITVHRENSS